MYKAWIVVLVAGVIAVAAIAWGITQYRLAEANARQIAQVEAAVQDELAEARARLSDAQRQLAAERDRLNRAELELARLRSAPEEEEQVAVAPMEETPFMAMMGGMPDGMPGPGEGGLPGMVDPSEDGPFGGIRNMLEGEQGREMARMGVRMGINMQYGDFFDDAGLSPERRQRVEEILESMMMDQMTAAMDMWGEEVDFVAMQRQQEAHQRNLRYELSKELNHRELELWDHYENTREERMLANAMDMQLGMFARGLTPENRTIVTDVLVEELRSGSSTTNMFDPAAAVDAQLDAYYRARARLDQALDPEQLAEFDRFVQNMENTMNMQRQFLSSMGSGQGN